MAATRIGDGKDKETRPSEGQEGDEGVQAWLAPLIVRRKGPEAEAGRRHCAERSPEVGRAHPTQGQEQAAAEIPVSVTTAGKERRREMGTMEKERPGQGQPGQGQPGQRQPGQGQPGQGQPVHDKDKDKDRQGQTQPGHGGQNR